MTRVKIFTGLLIFCCGPFFLFVTGFGRRSNHLDNLTAVITTTADFISEDSGVIVDSKMTLEEALEGKDIPLQIKNSLRIIEVEYYSFDKKLHKGQLIVNKFLADDLLGIFKEIKEYKFPVARVIPIVKYNWSDSLSMLDNNTSCFNYRVVKGTKVLSAHAKGRGIDINPFLNPQIKNGKTFPVKAEYNASIPGTITNSSIVVKAFKMRGWKWGGNWKSSKDYQHFEKM